jgi:hypothetical protein
MHATDGEPGVRRVLRLLTLANKHGAATVDDACAATLEVGVPTCRFVKRYLERGSPLRLGLEQVDPLIRQLTEYRDLIHRMARSPEWAWLATHVASRDRRGRRRKQAPASR